jgi:hypothetical protein
MTKKINKNKIKFHKTGTNSTSYSPTFLFPAGYPPG